MAKSQVASGSNSQQTEAKTAPPRESAASERARVNRLEAKSRASEKRAGSKGTGTQTESYFSRRSQLEHAENPDRASDSTVRHALPQTGADTSGQKGFPQGEYDVIEPSKASAASKRSTHDMLIDAHLGSQDPDEVMERVDKNARLDHEERTLILEGAPTGFVLEKMGDKRWRAGAANRYGHGVTASQAIESYVLGTEIGPDAATQAFLNYPASVQREIRERDEAVAKRQGIAVDSLPEVIARNEQLALAKIDSTAEPAAFNAVSDGAEKASARDEAGSSSTENGKGTSTTKKSGAKKSSSRKSAAKRK